MNTIRTVTVKRDNTMKVKDVRRQKSDDRRWEEERRWCLKKRDNVWVTQSPKNVCTTNIKNEH